ncbi:hypothetical protein Golax_012530, partial [Gossypium laxum]|nr:hypothetical protein [Gossypium laxum]
HFTSFFLSYLCKRLALLEFSSASRKSPIAATTSTSTAAFKAIFKPSRGGGNRIRFLPELQRVKSFSASKKEGSQKTLWSLFYRDAERNPHKKETAGNGRPFEIDEVEAPNLGSSSNVFQGPVFESKEEGRTESGIDHAGQMDELKLVSNAKVFPATVDYINGSKLGVLDAVAVEMDEMKLVSNVDYTHGPRRRKSRDRSGSIRKTAASIVVETDEMKLVSNVEASPATVDYVSGPKLSLRDESLPGGSAATVDYINGAKLVVPDTDSNSNSSRDHRFGNRERKGLSKKSWRWSKAWNIFWFIKRSVKKDEDGDRISELRTCREGLIRNLGQRVRAVLVDHLSVQGRAAMSQMGTVRRREMSLCWSATYSPNNIDNGLLRFYLNLWNCYRRSAMKAYWIEI